MWREQTINMIKREMLDDVATKCSASPSHGKKGNFVTIIEGSKGSCNGQSKITIQRP